MRHFLACVSKDAVGSETIVSIDIAGEKFTANGLVIHERNYLDVYVYDKWSAKQIHSYEQNQRFEPTEILLHEGATTAPPLLTEADLIALMEKHGIGTDATHAEHINTIKERGYIGVVDKGALVPGVIGMGLYEGYDAMELALAKPMLRAEFEADLKRICLGEKDPKLVLREQIAKYKQAYQQIMDKITAMDAKIAQRINETPAAAATGADSVAATEPSTTMRELFQCPKCDQAPLALKPKKNSPGSFFIGCLNFPDCKNVVWLPQECKEISVLDECCPTCGEGYHMLKFRLSGAYYRGVFNTPSGWYKNCLRCDELFRSTFNINLDQVKRVGNMVGQVSSSGGGPGPGPGGGGSGGGGRGPRGDGGGWGTGGGGVSASAGTQKATKPRRVTKTAAGDATGTQKSTRTKRKNSTTSSAGGIRSYFTSASAEANSLDGFFDSNDGFEEQLLAVADQAEADIAAAFAADDDADFEALLNEGGNGNDPQPPPSPPALETSLTEWVRQEYEAEEQPMLWGRQARDAAETQPTAKRQRLSGDSPASSSTAAAVVRCSGCHQPARQQTVQREGPNKGRQFYKCPKPNECKFFQWADEPPAATAPSRSSNSQSSCANNSSAWSSTNARGNSQTEPSRGSHNIASSWGTQNRSNSQTETSSWGSNNSQENKSREAGGSNSTSWGRSSQQSAENVATNWNRSNNSSSSGGAGSSTYMRSNSSSTVTITQTKTSGNGNDVQCNCSKPASSLTVVKDGPNKGRPFFACPTREREKSCGFFQWGDTDENQGELKHNL